jgi:hypothetical protein
MVEKGHSREKKQELHGNQSALLPLGHIAKQTGFGKAMKQPN